MIVGLGTDLCEVPRIEGAMARSGERFLARVFTPRERAAAEAAPHPAQALARYFALKESTFKTLGRGWPYGVSFLDVELEAPSRFAGRILLSGRAVDLARSKGAWRLLGSAAADDELAAAIVVAESAP